MSKKNSLSPGEVETIINGYLHALRQAKGSQVAEMTDLYYRKGIFHLRSAGLPREAMATPYSAGQIKAMTAEMQKGGVPF